jgi:hypothetical protein
LDLLWIIDPGHGWLRVAKESVQYLGIEVSHFSYIDSCYYYLEEDCDATTFLDKTNIHVDIPEITIDDFQDYRNKAGIQSLV